MTDFQIGIIIAGAGIFFGSIFILSIAFIIDRKLNEHATKRQTSGTCRYADYC